MAPRPPSRKKQKERPKRRRILRALMVFVLSLALLLTLSAWAAWAWMDTHLPRVFRFEDYASSALQVTRVLAADGSVIDELFIERRTVVPLDSIPKHLRDAVIAAEDGEFYAHRGVDPMGIARALMRDIAEGRFAQGGSTITQQVARTFYLTAEKTILRKGREAVLAFKLERELTKDAILALYLNQIYFGHGRWGVQEAARLYFGEDVQALGLAESALIAGVIQAPGRLSPFVAPEAARARRRYVLEQMVAKGLATPAAAREAERAPLPVAPGALQPIPVAPYFVDAVRRELSAVVGIDAVLRGGLRVRTTLDPRVQSAAEAAVATGLMDVDRRARVWADRDHVEPAIMGAHLAALAQERGHTAPQSGRIVRAIVTGVRGEAYEVDAGTDKGLLAFDGLVGRYAGTDAEARSLLRRGDLIPVSFRSAPMPGEELRAVTLELGPQVAIVALDPSTGAVRALVGGDDFAAHPFNRAVQARRQPGSTFKTFVYAAAIEKGVLEPDGPLENVERRYRNGKGGWWRPRNIDGVADGGTVTAREALARSINGIAVEVLRLTGVEAVRDLARRVGIASPLGRDLTLALGSSGVTLLELTGAYGVFAAGGLRAEPRLIDAVLDPMGRNVWPAPEPPKRAVSPEVAEKVASMLRAVVTTGTGKAAAIGGVVIAGKTGTSDAARDSWFVGWAPDLAVGVWVGHDDARPLRDGGGGRVAAPIWARFVASALGRPVGAIEEAAAAP